MSNTIGITDTNAVIGVFSFNDSYWAQIYEDNPIVPQYFSEKIKNDKKLSTLNS
jgi:hypothetical protein